MKRVAVYCRLSEEDRDKKEEHNESESIQNQKSMLIHYCMEKGWQVYKIYCDEDYSGADRNRPEWKEMIRDCKEGKIDIVLCKTQSRFSRDMEMIERYIHGKFLEWNVRFISIVDHADTEVAGNKKARQINGLINEWYLEDLSDNIRRTLTHKKKNGQWTGSFAPYGYQIDPDDKNRLIVDSVASEVVKDIFRMFAGGMGYIAIAEQLNARSILNPTLYKRALGSCFRTNESRITSELWTDSTVFYILHQEVYTGTLVQGKTHKLNYKDHRRVPVPKENWIRCPGTHEPIIDESLWTAVHVRQKEKTRCSFSNAAGAGTRHIFSNKVYCAECGNRMYKTSSRGANGRYSYLKCRTAKSSAKACENSKFVRLDVLQEVVLDEINQLIETYFNPNLIQMPSQKQLLSKETALRLESESLEKELAAQKKFSARLYMDHINGKMSEGQFAVLNDEWLSRYSQLINRQKAVEKELSSLQAVAQKTPTDRNEFSHFQKFGQLTHELVNEFIQSIWIGKIQENGTREIEIRWNFE